MIDKRSFSECEIRTLKLNKRDFACKVNVVVIHVIYYLKNKNKKLLCLICTQI